MDRFTVHYQTKLGLVDWMCDIHREMFTAMRRVAHRRTILAGRRRG